MTQLDADCANRGSNVFRLSAVLAGHLADVRSLSSLVDPHTSSLISDDYSESAARHDGSSSGSSYGLLSGSRDGTAASWIHDDDDDDKDGPGGRWRRDQVWDRGHAGYYVNSVCSFRLGRGRQSYVATAGSDALVQLYRLDSESEPIQTLSGHEHNVCSVRVDLERDAYWIATASWDGTARIWDAAAVVDDETKEADDVRAKLVLTTPDEPFAAAVWDVLVMNRNRDENELVCLTASADNHVRLYKGSNLVSTLKGHLGPVRALSKLFLASSDGGSENSSSESDDELLFASASNDGTVRIWNYATGQALAVLDHQDFIYSLAAIPPSATTKTGAGLASSGEDGLVKVWNAIDGKCDQTIEVPALSVWSVTILANGDLACGCSDDRIWVFTRSDDRVASTDSRVWQEYETGLIDYRERRRAKAATTTEGDRTEKEEELTFEIDISDDQPRIRLAFNPDRDDPHEVSEKFVREHELPESYIDEIVDFLGAANARSCRR